MLTNQSGCKSLIKVKNSFCDHYGITLDKYVNLSERYSQQWLNDSLWEIEGQYKVLYPAKNLSTECVDNYNFIACNIMFPGCDATTSEFQTKKFCKESCVYFMDKCSRFARFWRNAIFARHPDNMIWFDCSVKQSRNAGDSPECLYYMEKKRFSEEGMSQVDLLHGFIYSTS